jgi:hypothetical protein
MLVAGDCYDPLNEPADYVQDKIMTMFVFRGPRVRIQSGEVNSKGLLVAGKGHTSGVKLVLLPFNGKCDNPSCGLPCHLADTANNRTVHVHGLISDTLHRKHAPFRWSTA